MVPSHPAIHAVNPPLVSHSTNIRRVVFSRSRSLLSVFIWAFPRFLHRYPEAHSARSSAFGWAWANFPPTPQLRLCLAVLETDRLDVHLFTPKGLQPWCYKLSGWSKSGFTHSGKVIQLGAAAGGLIITLYVEGSARQLNKKVPPTRQSRTALNELGAAWHLTHHQHHVQSYGCLPPHRRMDLQTSRWFWGKSLASSEKSTD